MNVDNPTRCEQCSVPIRQTKTGRRRRYCSPACRTAAYRARAEAWTCMEEVDPQLATLPTMEDLYASGPGDGSDQGPAAGAGRGATPSPENSTIEDVTATIFAAVKVCAEFRRHGLAAPGLVAVRCASVGRALDAALAAEFGDVL